MEILKITRKMKCKDCGEPASFLLSFNKTKIQLCQNCLKQLNRSLSKTTAPLPVVTKFYLKR